MYDLSMAKEVTVSEARGSLAQIVDDVQGGEEVTLTRHGRPVAVVVRPDRLRVRLADAALADAEQVGQLLREARQAKLPVEPRLTLEQGTALLADVRASRQRR
jgi:prevent-host-death family protein